MFSRETLGPGILEIQPNTVADQVNPLVMIALSDSCVPLPVEHYVLSHHKNCSELAQRTVKKKPWHRSGLQNLSGKPRCEYVWILALIQGMDTAPLRLSCGVDHWDLGIFLVQVDALSSFLFSVSY